MWKPGQRLAADRSGLRYPSDLTWAIMIPQAGTVNVRVQTGKLKIRGKAMGEYGTWTRSARLDGHA